MIKRIIMSFIGVVLLAVSVAFCKTATLGVDPFQTLVGGLDKAIPINFGTLYMIINIVLLIFVFIFDKHYIGLATFINLFLLGYLIEFFYSIIQLFISNPSLIISLLLMIIAILIMCFGASLYITADLGVSTYDAIALIISNTREKGEFRIIRIISDFICVLIGFLLFVLKGASFSEIVATIGIGTIITAFFTGPLIEYFNSTFSKPLLNKDV